MTKCKVTQQLPTTAASINNSTVTWVNTLFFITPYVNTNYTPFNNTYPIISQVTDPQHRDPSYETRWWHAYLSHPSMRGIQPHRSTTKRDITYLRQELRTQQLLLPLHLVIWLDVYCDYRHLHLLFWYDLNTSIHAIIIRTLIHQDYTPRKH
jgi:hypothetical protein